MITWLGSWEIRSCLILKLSKHFKYLIFNLKNSLFDIIIEIICWFDIIIEIICWFDYLISIKSFY